MRQIVDRAFDWQPAPSPRPEQIYTSAQRDLKRLLGYSSTENVGIAGIGFGVGYLGLAWNRPALVILGFTGGILHLLNHAFFKCLLFYAAGAVYRATHTVDLERLGGLLRRMPWTGAYFLLGGLAISALPPFNGFVSEFVIYAGLLNPAAPAGIERALLVVVAALLAFVGGVSALSMTRAFGLVFLGTPRDAKVHCDGEVGPPMQLPMAVHGFGILLLGLVPAVGLAVVRQPVRLFTGLAVPTEAALPNAMALLTPVAWAGLAILLLIGALVLLRRWIGRGEVAPRRATWQRSAAPCASCRASRRRSPPAAPRCSATWSRAWSYVPTCARRSTRPWWTIRRRPHGKGD
jgi:hydrogenase-4 component B